MSKELEALERLFCAGRLDLDYVLNGKQNQDYKIIETALKDYELMKQPKIIFTDKKISDDDLEKFKNLGVIVGNLEQSKIEPLFDNETQKKLKALEIIKEKKIDLDLLKISDDLDDYNFMCDMCYKNILTKEEYDLLKKVLL